MLAETNSSQSEAIATYDVEAWLKTELNGEATPLFPDPDEIPDLNSFSETPQGDYAFQSAIENLTNGGWSIDELGSSKSDRIVKVDFELQTWEEIDAVTGEKLYSLTEAVEDTKFLADQAQQLQELSQTGFTQIGEETQVGDFRYITFAHLINSNQVEYISLRKESEELQLADPDLDLDGDDEPARQQPIAVSLLPEIESNEVTQELANNVAAKTEIKAEKDNKVPISLGGISLVKAPGEYVAKSKPSETTKPLALKSSLPLPQELAATSPDYKSPIDLQTADHIDSEPDTAAEERGEGMEAARHNGVVGKTPSTEIDKPATDRTVISNDRPVFIKLEVTGDKNDVTVEESLIQSTVLARPNDRANKDLRPHQPEITVRTIPAARARSARTGIGLVQTRRPAIIRKQAKPRPELEKVTAPEQQDQGQHDSGPLYETGINYSPFSNNVAEISNDLRSQKELTGPNDKSIISNVDSETQVFINDKDKTTENTVYSLKPEIVEATVIIKSVDEEAKPEPDDQHSVNKIIEWGKDGDPRSILKVGSKSNDKAESKHNQPIKIVRYVKPAVSKPAIRNPREVISRPAKPVKALAREPGKILKYVKPGAKFETGIAATRNRNPIIQREKIISRDAVWSAKPHHHRAAPKRGEEILAFRQQLGRMAYTPSTIILEDDEAVLAGVKLVRAA